jgi:hypothetical protein
MAGLEELALAYLRGSGVTALSVENDETSEVAK